MDNLTVACKLPL